jgi:glutamate--cysteine ligase
VSYNGLNEYVRDLSHAIRTPCAPFEKIGLKDGSGEYQQISTNILQIENEYYGLVRPKRTTGRGERPTTALSRRGVEYVELRCVDLNPFNPIGIDDSSAHFLEVFALHCLLSESLPFTDAEYAALPINQQQVVERGRDPALRIDVQGESRLFVEQAERLLADLQALAPVLDDAHGTTAYTQAIAHEARKLHDPELTYSATIVRELKENNCSFFEFAQRTGHAHGEHFRDRPLLGERAEELAVAATVSHREQAAIEAADTASFAEFLADWFRD